MSKASNRAKTKWNASNYTAIKVSAYPEVAAAFKAACAAAGASMASVLSQLMAQYAAVTDTSQGAGVKTAAEDPVPCVSTMKKRRKTVRAVAQLLEQVRDAEERFIRNAPENLQGAPIYEAAEEYVSVLECVIEQLGEIY